MSVIKKYSATSWHCQGCIQLQKLLDSLPEELTSSVESVDIDTVPRPELADLKIRGVPLLVAFDSQGQELGRLQGVPTKEVLEKFLGSSSSN